VGGETTLKLGGGAAQQTKATRRRREMPPIHLPAFERRDDGDREGSACTIGKFNYTLRDDVWTPTDLALDGGALCGCCLERRLGRFVTL
jgi:hypothetical protein